MKKILNVLVFIFLFFLCISLCEEYSIQFILIFIFVSILGSLIITKYLSIYIDKWSCNQVEKIYNNKINELISFIHDECEDIFILERIKEVTDMKISNLKKNNYKE